MHKVRFFRSLLKSCLQSTVSPTDCHAVSMALEGNVIRELRKGKIVRMGELGSYRLSVHAEGKETPEEVNTDATDL